VWQKGAQIQTLVHPFLRMRARAVAGGGAEEEECWDVNGWVWGGFLLSKR
jgi:hypothetical protein